MDWLSQYLFLYPVVMGVIWVIGGAYFYVRYERKVPEYPDLNEFPLVSVLVPAHNEAKHIVETVSALLRTDYPNYEILIIDDGSTDGTGEIAEQLAQNYEPVRALIHRVNMGKAAALNHGLLVSRGDILVTIDADCVMDPKALHWLAYHFVKHPRVGAVTGNPRVRNRTSLLAKIQAAEYASIIGLIKRTQRLLGKVLTVSGVIAAFRKQALLDCGLWDTDMVTEDINVTWKLEKRFWAVHYELNAIGWILVPETIRGLWKQRVRWAQGGIEVLRRHKGVWLSWKQRRLWPIYIDYLLSIGWAVSLLTMTILWTANSYFGASLPDWMLLSPIPQWTGSIIALTCLIQFTVSMMLDSKYDSSLYQHYIWVIWYPVVYWAFSALAVIWALPKAMLKRVGSNARWNSPDRGLHIVHAEAAATMETIAAADDSVIINAHHLVTMPRKLAEGTVMAVGLTIFSFFLILLTLAVWFFAGTYFYNHLLVPAYDGTMDTTVEMMFRLVLFGLFIFVALFIWAKYNMKTYGHLNRRRHPGPTDLAVLAQVFHTTVDNVLAAQGLKAAIVDVFYETAENWGGKQFFPRSKRNLHRQVSYGLVIRPIWSSIWRGPGPERQQYHQ